MNWYHFYTACCDVLQFTAEGISFRDVIEDSLQRTAHPGGVNWLDYYKITAEKEKQHIIDSNNTAIEVLLDKKAEDLDAYNKAYVDGNEEGHIEGFN